MSPTTTKSAASIASGKPANSPRTLSRTSTSSRGLPRARKNSRVAVTGLRISASSTARPSHSSFATSSFAVRVVVFVTKRRPIPAARSASNASAAPATASSPT